MNPTRRDFVLGSALLLTGCGGGATDAAPNPTPMPTPTPPASNLSAEMTALRSFVSANSTATADLPALATSAVTVTWSTGLSPNTAGTTLPAGFNVAITDSRISRTLPTQTPANMPGNPIISGMPCLRVDRSYSCKGVPRSIGSVQWLRFRTDAPIIEIVGCLPDGSYTAQTLLVDGKFVPAKVLPSYRTGSRGGYNFGAIKIAFTGRQMRDVWIETGVAVAYLRFDSGDLLENPNDVSEPQITVVGDSYLLGGSSNFANGGAIALELAARLGIKRVATDAIGGTGYWNSGNGLGNLNDRLTAHATDNSIVYLVMSGLNDYGDVVSSNSLVWPARAQYEQAVLGYLQGLRSSQPKALIVVTSPFCPIPPMSDSSYVAYAGTNSSTQGDFLYKAQLFKSSLSSIAGPWIYIDVLMGGGWLNSSGASGDITNLQWFTGGTAGPGTSSTNKPGNTNGGGGGGFGGIATVPVVSGGRYTQAPQIMVSGGSGSGLLLNSTINTAGVITSVDVVVPGSGYTANGLPTLVIDKQFEQAEATLGAPTLITGINPNGEYPLQSFAPPGVPASDLNNIYTLLSSDKVHPSPLGVRMISTRLARNIRAGLLAL